MTFLDDGTTKITATPIKWKEGMVKSCNLCNYQYVFFGSNLSNLGLLHTFIEGPSKWSCTWEERKEAVPRGRQVINLDLSFFFYVIFSVLAVGKLNSCQRQRSTKLPTFERWVLSQDAQSIFRDYDQIKHAIYSLLIWYI